MAYTLSLSYGKDSLACIYAIKKLGWPLDRIIYADLMATDTIHADYPEHIQFITHADSIIKSMTGIDVEHIKSTNSFESIFYREVKTGRRAGMIYGWPGSHSRWCNSKLKINTISDATKNDIQYVGIASDETKRIKQEKNVRYPLLEAGMTENDCKIWCAQNNLLSPLYSCKDRIGCWFCQFQSLDGLRFLRNNHQELWNIMLKWDKDSPYMFSRKYTISEYEHLFKNEINFPNVVFSDLFPTDMCFKCSMSLM